MTENIYKNLADSLPYFFDSQMNDGSSSAGIFEPIRKILEFDEGYVFFLNPDSIQLKYKFGKNQKLVIGNNFPISTNFKKELFSLTNSKLNKKNELIESLNLDKNESFVLIKLVIKNTVYGFILLSKNENDFYKQEHLDILNAIGAVISYKIKDLELSDIFKNQLKSLKDGFVQTQAAYKTIKEQNLKILEADNVKNEFLANISHELRTPLNAIIGFSEILSAKLYGDLNEKQAEYIGDIYISAIHLNGMINEILDISKLEAKAMSLHRTDFFVSQVITEVVNVIKPLSNKKKINVELQMAEDFLISADFQKIRQVLFNLLSNAIKFTKEKGEIDIIVKKNKKKFVIEVKDNGLGIAKKDLDKIFEKFMQLENAYTKKESSTGLGLTITKELVEMHNGTIKVESELKKGSSFIVEIPFKF